MSMSLQGRTVVVTRAQEQQGEAQKLLQAKGAIVLDLPALVIGPPSSWRPLDNALTDLGCFDWVIFSSANGVRAVQQRLKLLGKTFIESVDGTKTASVGRKTAMILHDFGVVPDFIPPDFVADSLIKHFPADLQGARVLLPRVQSGGRIFLAKAFADAGAKVVEVPAYESTCPLSIPEDTLLAFKEAKVDAIAFTSGKTVKHTYELLREFLGDNFLSILDKVRFVSIGPQTSLICEQKFKRVDKEASTYDLEGLVDACALIL